MAPPLLKCQKLTLLNKLSESHCAPPTQKLPLPESGGDQNVQQPMANQDQSSPHHHMATFEVA